MSGLRGFIANNGYAGKSDLWSGMRSEDMRAKEKFKPGCLVDCIDRPALHDGTLLEVDADGRLGKVEWSTGHKGWWYLKDLVVIGFPMVMEPRRAYGRTPLQKSTSDDQLLCQMTLDWGSKT